MLSTHRRLFPELVGLAYPQNVSIPIGLVIQGAYEKVSPNTCCPRHLVFSCSLENIYSLCGLCVLYQFWINIKKKKGASQKAGLGLHPSHTDPADCLLQLYAKVLGVLWSLISRATCPTIAKLQSTEEDNSNEGIGLGQVYDTNRIWEVWAVRDLWHFEISGRCICFWPTWSSKFSRN